MKELEKVAEMLYGLGDAQPGLDMTLEQARAHVESISDQLNASYCIVQDWIWVDLILPDHSLKIFQAAGKQLIILYSYSVLFDLNHCYGGGDWVRTTPLVSFSDGCFFRTSNTIYILLGNGFRKQAELSTVMSLHS